MNRFVYILSGVCMLVQACSIGILLLHHEINQEVIAARYCINRNKPVNPCAGSCQLHKSLKETGKTQKPFRASSNETSRIILFFQAPAPISFCGYPVYPTFQTWYQAFTPEVPQHKFFHPPKPAHFLPVLNPFT